MKKPNKILSFLVALSMMTSSMVGLASVSYAEGEEAAADSGIQIEEVTNPDLTAIEGKTTYIDENFDTYEVGHIVDMGNGSATEPVTKGNITYGVGSRNGGDTQLYIAAEAKEDSETDIMLDCRGTRFSSANRNAYFTMDYTADSSQDLVLEFDTKFPSATTGDIQIGDGTTTVATISQDIIANTDMWYNVKVVLHRKNNTYYVLATDALGNGKLLSGSAAASALTRFDFAKAGTSFSAYIDNLQVYAVANALNTVTFTVTDESSNPVANAEMAIAGQTKQTEADGTVAWELPIGTYNVKTAADGYLISDTTATVEGKDIELPITMKERPAPIVTTIQIGGGSEYVYTPVKEGTVNKTEAYTATIFDQSELEMPEEGVTWSLKEPVTGVTVDPSTGVVSVDSTVEGFEATDGVITVTVVATSSTKTDVTEEKELTIRNKQVPKDWSVMGSYAIKAGASETYTIENVVNQYGEAYPGYADENYVISLALETPAAQGETPLLTFDGLKATAAAISTDTEKTNVVSKCGDIQKKHEITVWGNNTKFYDAGISKTAYSQDARFETIGTDSVLVWPKVTQTAGATSTLTLPEAITVENGKAVELSWKSTWTTKETSTVRRTLGFKDSNGNQLLTKGALHLSSFTFGFNSSKVNDVYVNEQDLGRLGDAGQWVDCSLIIKKSATGATTALITINGQQTQVDISGTDIKTIELTGDKGGPEDRLLGIKDICIREVSAPDFEFTTKGLVNDTDVAKVSGQTITRDYEVSVFGELAQGEVLTWEFTGAGEGLTFTPNAEDQTKAALTITDAATPGAYTVTVTSSNAEKEPAQLTVNVHDFAEIASFDISGPTTLARGGSATYTVSNIVDEYGDPVTFAPVWSVAPTDTGAAIDAETGVLTTTDQTGDVTVTATLGNPGKEKPVDYVVKVGDFTYKAENPQSTEIDISSLISYGATKYKVVVKTAEGVTTSEKTAVNDKITLDTIDGVLAVEVIPCYLFDFGDGAVETGYMAVKSTDVFSAATGYGLSKAGSAGTGTLTGVQADGITNMNTAKFQIALPDGTYDFTFYKMDTPRTSISVNGNLVAARVDADNLDNVRGGIGNDTITPSIYTAKDIKVIGGMAEISTSEKSFALAGVDIVKKSEYEVRKTHIYLAGDSTVSNYYPLVPVKGDYADGERRTGWGQLFDMFLSDEVIVDNLALAGDYADSWAKNVFPTILTNAEEGDYLFIQFGINDRNKPEELSQNDRKAAMVAAIDKMVKACYEKGIIPVLLNPQICMTQYGAAGEYEQSYGSGNAGFYKAIMDYAKQNNVLYLDLTELSGSYYAMIGKTAVNTMYFLKGGIAADGSQRDPDPQHMSYKGALKVAELVATGIYDRMANGAIDAHGNTFAGIPLNSLVQYDITYTNSEGQSVTEKFTAVECERKQTGAAAFVPSEDQGIALRNTLNISEPTVVGGKINVDVTNNMLAEPKDVTVYVASYDENGVCVGVSVASGKVRPQKTTTLTVNAPTEGANTSKVMVWDTSEMDPLAQAKAPSQSAQ